ncbi:MAG: hypothetical protein ABJQ29_09665 [Luteolibacter sp.]
MQDTNSTPPSGKTARHFTRHYHRSSETKIKIPSKCRRVIDQERKTRGYKLLTLLALCTILISLAILLREVFGSGF